MAGINDTLDRTIRSSLLSFFVCDFCCCSWSPFDLLHLRLLLCVFAVIFLFDFFCFVFVVRLFCFGGTNVPLPCVLINKPVYFELTELYTCGTGDRGRRTGEKRRRRK